MNGIDPELPGATRNRFESLDEPKQLRRLALLQLAGLQRDEEEPSSFQIVRVKKHLNERRLHVAPLILALGRFAIEDHSLILRDATPRSTGLGNGLL